MIVINSSKIKIAIYSNQINNKIIYAFSQIFNHPNIVLLFFQNFEEFKNFDGIKIYYATYIIESTQTNEYFFIQNKYNTLSTSPKKSYLIDNEDIPFTFYWVLTGQAENEIVQKKLYNSNFLDQLREDIFINIENKYNIRLPRKPPAKLKILLDIDRAYKYKFKSFFNLLLNNIIKERSITLPILASLNILKDPWDFSSFGKALLKIFNIESIIFFHSGLIKSKKDIQINLKKSEIIKEIKKGYESEHIGLHASWTSLQYPNFIIEEKKFLEEIFNKQITYVRQHYINIKFHETYRWYLKSGLDNDYSAQFVEFPGFRYGTAHPFNFFDIINEQETPLIIHPVVAMDMHFLQNSKLNGLKIKEVIKNFKNAIEKTGGEFNVCIHNTLYDNPHNTRTIIDTLFFLL